MTEFLGKLSGAVVLAYGFTVFILSAGSAAFGFVVRQTIMVGTMSAKQSHSLYHSWKAARG